MTASIYNTANKLKILNKKHYILNKYPSTFLLARTAKYLKLIV